MKIFDRFKKTEEDILPEDVEKYYRSQQRARVGTAWLLGFLTLVITLIVALGLFYGVRYAYRELTGKDDTTQVTPTGTSQNGTEQTSPKKPKKKPSGSTTTSAPRTGDTLPANGDTPLPATGDPGL